MKLLVDVISQFDHVNDCGPQLATGPATGSEEKIVVESDLEWESTNLV